MLFAKKQIEQLLRANFIKKSDKITKTDYISKLSGSSDCRKGGCNFNTIGLVQISVCNLIRLLYFNHSNNYVARIWVLPPFANFNSNTVII